MHALNRANRSLTFVKRWLYHREFISELQSSFIFSCLFHSFRLCHASHWCRLACQTAARVLMWRSINTVRCSHSSNVRGTMKNEGRNFRSFIFLTLGNLGEIPPLQNNKKWWSSPPSGDGDNKTNERSFEDRPSASLALIIPYLSDSVKFRCLKTVAI